VITEPHALVIGEALTDIILSPAGNREYPGGSPMNVAVGLARLGRPTTLLTWIGQDARGDAIKAHLAESGVALAPGSDGAPHTSTAQATLDEHGAASYVFDLSWQVPAAGIGSAPIVLHAGSLAGVVEPGDRAVAQLFEAKLSGATLTYDPNVRPQIMGTPELVRERIEHLVGLADVVKSSDEDLAWLYPGVAPELSARRWLDTGLALMVVTRGGEGAFALVPGGERVDERPRPAQVVDTVGAGDSFMGGMIDALWRLDLLGRERREALYGLDGGAARQVLQRAGQVAAVTVSRAGANPPWARELAG
jgi:fructokinase